MEAHLRRITHDREYVLTLSFTRDDITMERFDIPTESSLGTVVLRVGNVFRVALKVSPRVAHRVAIFAIGETVCGGSCLVFRCPLILLLRILVAVFVSFYFSWSVFGGHNIFSRFLFHVVNIPHPFLSFAG